MHQTLKQIKDKSLNLIDHKLNDGQVKGLVAHFKSAPKNVIRIVLDNNGISDEQLSALLEATQHLEMIKSLLVRNNVFGSKSIQAIKPVLIKELPFNLTELRIMNCRIAPFEVKQLFDSLLDSKIRKLGLVNANVNGEVFADFMIFMQE